MNKINNLSASDKRLYVDLCRLYEAGCTHEEVFSTVGATSQDHVDVIEELVKDFGHTDGLSGLRDFCVKRAKARLKLVLMETSALATDVKGVLSGISGIDEISSVDRTHEEISTLSEDELVRKAMENLKESSFK